MTIATGEIAAAMKALMAKFDMPGAGVAIVTPDDTAALGFGICEKGHPGTVAADTTFQIASCSKAYTATAAAVLVDRGLLGFDDPVRKHLPEFQLHDERLTQLATVRDLLSMRLGYRKQGLVDWGRNTELGVSYIFERLRYAEPIAGFRELFTYLNAAYALVAEIVARKSGKSFPEFLNEAVIEPLGLSRTFVHEGFYDPEDGHAFPHVILDAGVEPVGEARCGGRIGESCVYSTATDAARWMRLHLGRGEVDGTRLVSETAMREMHRPHVFGPNVPALDNYFLAYGMGWQCRDSPNGPLLMHEGGEFGVSTHTILDPLRKIGVAVYANLGSGAAVKSASYALLDIAAGRTPRDWSELFPRLDAQDQVNIKAYLEAVFVKAPERELGDSDIVGSYFNPGNGVVDVARVGGQLALTVREGWLYDADLEPTGANCYRSHARYKGMQALGRQLNLRMQFVEDDDGIKLVAPGFGEFRKLDVPVR